MPRKQFGFFESSFAPEITNRDGVEMHAVSDSTSEDNAEKYREWYRKWQSEAESIRIPAGQLPEAFVEALVFGKLMSDEVIDKKMVEDFKVLPGSSGIGSSKESIVSNFFCNTVTKDKRINMQFIRSGVPKARQLVKEMVESGNRDAMLETVKTAVQIYGRNVAAFGTIETDYWNEAVYRFDELAQAIDAMGIDRESVGFDRRLQEKLAVSRQVSDLCNEMKDIQTSVPETGVLTGENREKKIRAEAIMTVLKRLNNDHHGIADAYSVAGTTYGDVAENLNEGEARALEAPLTALENRILANGAESIIQEYVQTLTAKYEGMDITSKEPVSFATSSLIDETEGHTLTNALWDGMAKYDGFFDRMTGINNNIDKRIEKIKSLRTKFAADPDNISYEDFLELKINVERLNNYATSWEQKLNAISEDDDDIPKDITFDSHGNALYKGVNPAELHAISFTGGALDKVSLDEIKNSPPQRTYSQFKNDMTRLANEFIADTSSFSKNSEEYKDLCEALQKFIKPGNGRTLDEMREIFTLAMDYSEHVGDRPRNDRQARRLALCNEIVRNVSEMQLDRRLRKAIALDAQPAPRRAERRPEAGQQAPVQQAQVQQEPDPKAAYRSLTPDALSAKTEELIREAEAGIPALLETPVPDITKDNIRQYADHILSARYNAVLDELVGRTGGLDAKCNRMHDAYINGKTVEELEADPAYADERIKPFIRSLCTAIDRDRENATAGREMIRLTLHGRDYSGIDYEGFVNKCTELGIEASLPTGDTVLRRSSALDRVIDVALENAANDRGELPRWAGTLLKKPGITEEEKRRIISDWSAGKEGQQRVLNLAIDEIMHTDPAIFSIKSLDDYLSSGPVTNYYCLLGWDKTFMFAEAARLGLEVDPELRKKADVIGDKLSAINNHFSFACEAAASPLSVCIKNIEALQPDKLAVLMATAEKASYEQYFSITAMQAVGIELENNLPALKALAEAAPVKETARYFNSSASVSEVFTYCALDAVKGGLSKEQYLSSTDIIIKTAEVPMTAAELNQKLKDMGSSASFRTLSPEEKAQRIENRKAALETLREMAYSEAQSGMPDFARYPKIDISVREYMHIIYRRDLSPEENEALLKRYAEGNNTVRSEIANESLSRKLRLLGNPEDLRQPVSDGDLALLYPVVSEVSQALMQEYDSAMKTWRGSGVFINPALHEEIMAARKTADPALQHYSERFKLMTSAYYTELDERELVKDDLCSTLSDAFENSEVSNNELTRISSATSSIHSGENGIRGEFLLATLPENMSPPDAVFTVGGRMIDPGDREALGKAADENGILLFWKEGMEYPAAFTVESSVFPPRATRVEYERLAAFAEGKNPAFDMAEIPDESIDLVSASGSIYIDSRAAIAQKKLQLSASRAAEAQRAEIKNAADTKAAAEFEAARKAELENLSGRFRTVNEGKLKAKAETLQQLDEKLQYSRTYLGMTLNSHANLSTEEFGNNLRKCVSEIMITKLIRDKLDKLELTADEATIRKAADDSQIEKAAAEIRKSPMFNRFMNSLSIRDLRNLSMDIDGKPVMENALGVYNERFTKTLTEVRKHQADRSADFWKISKAARQRSDATAEFLSAVEARSAFGRYDQHRLDDKQILADMLLVYRPFMASDKRLAPVMEKLELLAGDDSTAARGNYWRESDRYLQLIKELESYEQELDRREEALADESRRLFKKEDGTWMTDAELRSADTDPELRKKNREQLTKAERLDDCRRICADLRNYLENQRDGRLEERTVDDNGNVIERDDIFNGKGLAVDHYLRTDGVLAKVGTALAGDYAAYDAPLFPHEPCMADISQGALGDCYYLTALANIARLHPEKIREAIRENEDGKTVTVRLYSKNAEGVLKPNYIVVDKKISKSMGIAEEGGVNSLWVSCFERALAVSGLNTTVNGGSESAGMVPKDIKERAERLAKKSSYTEQDRAENPWLFSGRDFIGWPAMENINGGNVGIISECLLGPGYEKLEKELPDLVHNPRKYLNVKLDSREKVYEMIFRAAEFRTDDPAVLKDVPLSGDLTKEKTAYIKRFAGPDPTPEQLADVQKGFDLFERSFAELLPDGADMSLENLMAVQNKLDHNEKMTKLPEIGMLAYTFLTSDLRIILMERTRYNTIEDGVFNAIREGQEKKLYMGAGSTGNDREAKTNVFTGHAYSVLGTYEDPDSGFRFVRMRNPWGNRSKLFAAAAGSENAIISTFDEDGKIKTAIGTQEDGVFDMELHDFIHDFSHLYINGLELNRDTLLTAKETPDKCYDTVSAALDAKDGTRIYLSREADYVINKGTPAPEVVAVGINEAGEKYFTIAEGGGEENMSLSLAVKKYGKISIEHPLPEAAPVKAAAKADPSVVDYRTMSNYLRTVEDYSRALKATDHCLSKDSPQYKALRESLKKASVEIVHTRGRDFARLKDALSPVEKAVKDYREHCEKDPRAGNVRRNTRLEITGEIGKMLTDLKNNRSNPRLEVQKTVARRMINDALRTRGREMTPEAVETAAEQLTENKFFAGCVDRENLFMLSRASDEQIHKLNLTLEARDPKMVTEKENTVLNVEHHARNRIL